MKPIDPRKFTQLLEQYGACGKARRHLRRYNGDFDRAVGVLNNDSEWLAWLWKKLLVSVYQPDTDCVCRTCVPRCPERDMWHSWTYPTRVVALRAALAVICAPDKE